MSSVLTLPTDFQRPRWSAAVDQELLQTRSEIENAPTVNDDVNLYAPLFRNVSRFKRYHLIIRFLDVETSYGYSEKRNCSKNMSDMCNCLCVQQEIHLVLFNIGINYLFAV